EALPAIRLSNEQAICIKHGQSLNLSLVDDLSGSSERLQGTVRMYNDAVFLGLGEMLRDGKLAPKKLFNMSNGPVSATAQCIA
ncbi:tRNA pseudouridine(55) synthase TruB, partial [Methylobacter sp.]|uniref:tRNA pseudouridine(55) synthase TruB n=1 Tax=Methylobacter sp. TaxID=2051955 RepID=UPI001218C9D1